MAYLHINNVSVKGIAAAVPKRVKEIKEQPCFKSIEEAEKTIASTHVERSRMVPEGMVCSDLCLAAAEKIIAELGWNKEDIDALIFVSLSRDYLTPATAGILQNKLGLSTECLAYDIPLACSGYIYGLSTLASMMSTGEIKKALLLVGETPSFLQSSLDKSLWSLHGDAGTATAMEFDEKSEPMYYHLATDGSGWNAIINLDGGTRNPFNEQSLVMEEIYGGIKRRRLDSEMKGMDVFSFSITKAPRSIMGLCNHFGINVESADYLLLHQANKYMDDKIAKKVKVPVEKVPFTLMQYGNTSSASIPMNIVAGIDKGDLDMKAHVLMCGFGAGLSWGSAYVTLDHIKVPELIELD